MISTLWSRVHRLICADPQCSMPQSDPPRPRLYPVAGGLGMTGGWAKLTWLSCCAQPGGLGV